MSHARSKHIDMTSGPMLGKMLLFILPLVATNLLQHFYTAADVMIVELSGDPDAVGAVGSAGSYLTLITNIFIGFSTGSSVVVARNIGAGNREATTRSVHTSILMGLIFGTLGGVVGIALTRPVFQLMGYSGHLFALAERYAYIYLACIPFLALTNFLCAIMRANGDSRTSLYVLSATGVLNIGLNLFFVTVCGMSVEGVAIATAIANVVSSVVLWISLVRSGGVCRIYANELKISKHEFSEVARIGFPAGIQSALFSISNMVIQSSILTVNDNVLNGVGIDPAAAEYAPVIKGNSAASSLENFVFNALMATTVTSSTFTGQNVGCGNYRRVKRGLWLNCLISSVIAVGMTVILIALNGPLLALYGVANTSDTLGRISYETAMTRIWWKWTPFILYALMNAASGVLRGLGRSMSTALIALIGTCLFRVVWIYTIFAAWQTLEVIYISYAISWFLTGAVFMAFVIADVNKRLRESEAKTAEQSAHMS